MFLQRLDGLLTVWAFLITILKTFFKRCLFFHIFPSNAIVLGRRKEHNRTQENTHVNRLSSK